MSSTPQLTTPPPSPTSATPATRSAQVNSLSILIDNSKSKNQPLQIHAALIRITPYTLLFNRTHNPNVFQWTAIIHAHTQSGLNNKALSYYTEMLTHHVQPNAFTFSSLLNGSTLQSSKAIHCHVIKFGLSSDTYVATGLVNGYARGGDVVSAEEVFDNMPEKSLVSFTTMLTCYAKHGSLSEARLLFEAMGKNKDVVCWNVMMDGYAQHDLPNECLLLFRKMLVERVRPNVITLLAVLSSCGQLGALESGKWVHSYIENRKNGVVVEVRLGTALVDMYCKCGSLEDAREVFDKIEGRDVVAWNSMIMGYAIHGFSEEAFKLFHEMCGVGVKPSNVTFIALLTACGHSGLVSKGWEIFNLMKNEYEMELGIEHFGCMVNLLGRAGHLQEAYELLRSMKIDPDPVMWGTLLRACRLHNKISLEEIAEFLLSSDLASSGTYVLASYIYVAAAGNCVGAA